MGLVVVMERVTCVEREVWVERVRVEREVWVERKV
jgi:hypothetical protein